MNPVNTFHLIILHLHNSPTIKLCWGPVPECELKGNSLIQLWKKHGKVAIYLILCKTLRENIRKLSLFLKQDKVNIHFLNFDLNTHFLYCLAEMRGSYVVNISTLARELLSGTCRAKTKCINTYMYIKHCVKGCTCMGYLF